MSEPCGFCGQENSSETVQCVACGAVLVAHLHVLGKGVGLRNGRYHLGRILGEGGFGITYQGTDMNLGRAVAIKEFFPQGSTRHGSQMIPPANFRAATLQQMIQEFLEEARVLSLFDHKHIVPVYDVFEENSTAYMVMQFLKGTTLEDIVTQSGPLPEIKVIHYLQQVGSALEEVHAKGLLHRDIKPGNVMITAEDRAVLIDFGSAREFVEGATQKQTQIITSGFAPPEQYALQARRGGYTDVYALAATAYYLLSGQIPTGAMDRLFGNELVSLTTYRAELSPWLVKALEFGMALRVEDRASTVREFLDKLQAPPEPVVVPAPTEPIPRKISSISVWLRPKVVRVLKGQYGLVSDLFFQPGGRILVSASRDSFMLWDMEKGEKIQQFATDGAEKCAVNFSPDGQALYTATSRGQITLWDIASRQPYHAFAKVATNSNALTFSPDGIFLAIGSEEERSRLSSQHQIKLIALNDGSTYWTFRGHRGGINTLSYAPDSQSLISGSSDGTVRLWQVGNEEHIWSLALPERRIATSVALHPDQQILAIGTTDGHVQLWNLSDRRLIAQTQQALASVAQIKFHPSGYLLVGVCSAPTEPWGVGVHLWDVVTSRHRLNALVTPLRQSTSALAFSPDGQQLVVATTDGLIHCLSNRVF